MVEDNLHALDTNSSQCCSGDFCLIPNVMGHFHDAKKIERKAFLRELKKMEEDYLHA